jgi:putative hemolysin
MNEKLLILFVILLLGLILCSFLGGKGCVEGFTVDAEPQSDGTIVVKIDDKTVTLTKNADGSYTGPNGHTATANSDGSFNVTSSDGTTTTSSSTTPSTTPSTTSSTTSSTSPTTSAPSYDDYNHYSGASTTTYYGPNGGTAKIVDNGGQDKVIIVRLPNGQTQSYYITGDNSGTSVSRTTYTGPNGGTAKIVTDSNGHVAIQVTINGKTTLYTINANSTSIDSTINQYDSTSTTSTGSDYNNAYVYTGPNGNTAAAVTGPNGNTVVGTNYDSSAYYSSLPPGIPANQIPSGQEDLYILKSQVVPPVCPKCPDPIIKSSDDSDTSKCPPCPPCARCPEPAFDCKKVPNYNAFNPSYMPMPVVSDFSSFGM